MLAMPIRVTQKKHHNCVTSTTETFISAQALADLFSIIQSYNEGI